MSIKSQNHPLAMFYSLLHIVTMSESIVLPTSGCDLLLKPSLSAGAGTHINIYILTESGRIGPSCVVLLSGLLYGSDLKSAVPDHHQQPQMINFLNSKFGTKLTNFLICCAMSKTPSRWGSDIANLPWTKAWSSTHSVWLRDVWRQDLPLKILESYHRLTPSKRSPLLDYFACCLPTSPKVLVRQLVLS